MQRTIIIALAALLLLSAPVRAQNPLLDTGTVTAVSSGGACSAAPAGCAVFALGNGALVSVTLQVSGTFTGTLLYEATSDGTNWFTISGTKLADGSSSTGFASVAGTNTGQFSFSNSGLLSIRVRATAWTSGTASIAAVRGYAIARWLTPFLATGSFSTGIGLASTATIGWSSTTDPTAAADTLFCRGAAGVIGLGGCTSSFPALKRSSNALDIRLGDDSNYATISAAKFNAATAAGFTISSILLISGTAPSAPSACGTSPVVTSNNGTAAFVITGGTGGTATGCAVTMPAATTGWNCSITNITQTAAHRADRATVQTASTTTSVTWEYVIVSTGAATAFTASDVFRGSCFAF